MSNMNMSPPHISDMPQPYQSYPTPTQPEVVPQYQQNPTAPPQPVDYKGVPVNAPADAPADAPVNASVVAQNYRDQLFAQCAMGNHERKTEYGMCGIITAVACFPCGLICLFMDKKELCSRCGVSLEKKKKQ